MGDRRQWINIFKVLKVKKKIYWPSILYPAKPSFKNENKVYPREIMREFVCYQICLTIIKYISSNQKQAILDCNLNPHKLTELNKCSYIDKYKRQYDCLFFPFSFNWLKKQLHKTTYTIALLGLEHIDAIYLTITAHRIKMETKLYWSKKMI